MKNERGILDTSTVPPDLRKSAEVWNAVYRYANEQFKKEPNTSLIKWYLITLEATGLSMARDRTSEKEIKKRIAFFSERFKSLGFNEEEAFLLTYAGIEGGIESEKVHITAVRMSSNNLTHISTISDLDSYIVEKFNFDQDDEPDPLKSYKNAAFNVGWRNTSYDYVTKTGELNLDYYDSYIEEVLSKGLSLHGIDLPDAIKTIQTAISSGSTAKYKHDYNRDPRRNNGLVQGGIRLNPGESLLDRMTGSNGGGYLGPVENE